jgi:hypothetical protein
LSTGIAAIVVQFGLAMMPSGVLSTSAPLTSLTTNGTCGSRRQAEELSMTSTPAAANRGDCTLDIEAPAGAAVRAVAPGRVVHAGWFKGYGNIVIVDHGEGYHTLVAHLASMRTAMGEDVPAGAVLGTVGDTGSLKGAYLYFELREKGRPVDPRPWLAP